MKRLTDPDFVYTPSIETDLRKLFARIRREQRAESAKIIADAVEAAAKVQPLQKKKPT